MLLTVNPAALRNPFLLCRKDVLPQGNGGTNALVGTRLSFIEEDIKAKLCRPLHGLKQNC